MTGPRLAYFLVIAALVAWTGSHLFPPINLDVGALIYVAERWVSGDRLYVDVIDPNTPWAIALHVPAVVFARAFGPDAPTWFSLFVCLAIGGAIGLAARIWRDQGRSEPLTGYVLVAAGLVVLGVLPGSSFGQREHLMMIGALPYLVLASSRAEGIATSLSLRLGVAVPAGLAFAVKPYFVAPLLLVELWLLGRRGWRATFADIVPWAIGGILVAHLALALLLTPEYFSLVIPFTRATYEDPIGQLSRALPLLTGADLLPVTLVLPVLAAIAFLWRGSSLAQALALFTLGALASAVLQGKGWDYQALPALGGTLLLALLLAAALISRWAGRDAGPPALAGLIAACLVLPVALQIGLRSRPFREQLDFPASAAGQWIETLNAYGGNRRLIVLSDGMYPQFPAITYAGFKMAMPFITLWPIAGLYQRCEPGEPRYRATAGQSAEEAFTFRSVVDTVLREKPAIVVVDRYPGIPACGGAAFDYLAYFMRDIGFAEAFRAYRPLSTLDGRYDFYVRG